MAMYVVACSFSDRQSVYEISFLLHKVCGKVKTKKGITDLFSGQGIMFYSEQTFYCVKNFTIISCNHSKGISFVYD